MTVSTGYVHPTRARTIVAILAVLPATKVEIEQLTGINHTTVVKVVREMHRSTTIHVGKWRPHPVHGPSMAVYYAGPGEDAKDELPRLTRKQISDRYEKRLKGTEGYHKRKARHRNRYWTEKAAATPKNWAAALFI